MRFYKVYLLILIILTFYKGVYAIDCNPPDCTKTELKKGILWFNKTYSNLLGGPQNVNIVDVDLNDPHIFIKPVYKLSSSCEKTSSMGKRTAAIAGINGGFFDSQTGCSPLGLLKIDNKVISYAVSYRPPRSAVGIQVDKNILFRRTDSTDSFPEAIHALGGMPNLVKNGAKYVTTSEEQAESIAGVNPRTAICKTSNKHFLMITVDGRAAGRTGMNLDDLAQYLLWLGCTDGINLDGGGSTTMWVYSKGVVNYPSDGTERAVSNGLFVYYIDNLPPVIEHLPLMESPLTDIVIIAKVTDDTGLKAVNLKFRNKGEVDFLSRSMVPKGNDIYEAVINVQDIKSDLIQYYIAAWDGELRTVLPSDAETDNHYFEIKILNPTDAGYEISEIGDDVDKEDVSENIYDVNVNDVSAEIYDVVLDVGQEGDITVDDVSDINIDECEDIIGFDITFLDSIVADTLLFDEITGDPILDSTSIDSSYDVDKMSDGSVIVDVPIGFDIGNEYNEDSNGCSCVFIE